jgi:hypothetical protein
MWMGFRYQGFQCLNAVLHHVSASSQVGRFVLQFLNLSLRRRLAHARFSRVTPQIAFNAVRQPLLQKEGE